MRRLLAVVVGIALAATGTIVLAARDSSGTYSRPAGNPVVSGTPITATWMNTLSADIATELTDSVSRSGKGALLAPLKLYSGGNATTPELVWSDDTNSGLYLIADDNIGMSIGGTKRWDYAAAGSTLTGTLTVSGAATLQSTLGVTSTITSGAITAPSLISAAATDLTLGAPTGQSAHLQANGATGFSVLTGGTNDNKSRKLVNVTDPTAAQDAATKTYCDSAAGAAVSYTVGTNWTDLGSAVGRVGKLVSVSVWARNAGSATWIPVTLPVGARPSVTIYTQGLVYDSSVTAYYDATFTIDTSGNVTATKYDNATSQVAMFAVGNNDETLVNATFYAP